jgi:hypothetical protein
MRAGSARRHLQCAAMENGRRPTFLLLPQREHGIGEGKVPLPHGSSHDLDADDVAETPLSGHRQPRRRRQRRIPVRTRRQVSARPSPATRLSPRACPPPARRRRWRRRGALFPAGRAEQVWARRGRHARRDHEAGLPRLVRSSSAAGWRQRWSRATSRTLSDRGRAGSSAPVRAATRFRAARSRSRRRARPPGSGRAARASPAPGRRGS